MKIYHYHPITGEYLSEGTADLSPADAKQGREVYLIPAHATNIMPPANVQGKSRVFDGEWKYVDIEIVAEKDTDNSSPSTETAFKKVARLLEDVTTELADVKVKLIEKEERIINLEQAMIESTPLGIIPETVTETIQTTELEV